MSTQPIQIDDARRIMRGQARDLRHNRRVDDAAIAEANKAKLEERQRIPLSWRVRGAWERLWARRTGGKARVR